MQLYFKTNEVTPKKFVDFNCVYSIKNNWIETENLGVGKYMDVQK